MAFWSLGLWIHSRNSGQWGENDSASRLCRRTRALMWMGGHFVTCLVQLEPFDEMNRIRGRDVEQPYAIRSNDDPRTLFSFPPTLPVLSLRPSLRSPRRNARPIYRCLGLSAHQPRPALKFPSLVAPLETPRHVSSIRSSPLMPRVPFETQG